MSQPSPTSPPDWAAVTEKLTSMHLDMEQSEGFNAGSDLFKIPEGDDLKKAAALLMNQAYGSEKEIAAGNAPHIPVVNLSPLFDSADVARIDTALTEMSSITALFSAIWNINKMKQRGRTEPYRISEKSESNQAFTDLADSVWEAITTGLAGFYTLGSVSSETYTRDIRRTEVHLEFLTEIFQSFFLSKQALTQLDGLLTKFVSSISSIQIKKESVSKDVCQIITLDQILRVNKSGDDTQPVWLYVPVKRLIYLKIDANSWSNTVNVGKNKMIDVGMTFKMEYRVVDATLNVSKYLEYKAKFDEIFKTLTSANLEVFGKAIKSEPIQGADPK